MGTANEGPPRICRPPRGVGRAQPTISRRGRLDAPQPTSWTALVELHLDLRDLALDLDVVAQESGLELVGRDALGGLAALGREFLRHLRGAYELAHVAIDRVEDRPRRAGRREQAVGVRDLEAREPL